LHRGDDSSAAKNGFPQTHGDTTNSFIGFGTLAGTGFGYDYNGGTPSATNFDFMSVADTKSLTRWVVSTMHLSVAAGRGRDRHRFYLFAGARTVLSRRRGDRGSTPTAQPRERDCNQLTMRHWPSGSRQAVP
jgi:hypothetical protein